MLFPVAHMRPIKPKLAAAPWTAANLFLTKSLACILVGAEAVMDPERIAYAVRVTLTWIAFAEFAFLLSLFFFPPREKR